MPHLTLATTQGEPLVDIYVAVSQARQNALTAAGQPIPPIQRVRALVDTGATCSCIDASILSALNIPPTGATSVLTPSTGATPHIVNEYDVDIMFLHKAGVIHTVQNIAVIESILAPQGIQALIRLDILANALMIYDGENSSFTLAF